MGSDAAATWMDAWKPLWVRQVKTLMRLPLMTIDVDTLELFTVDCSLFTGCNVVNVVGGETKRSGVNQD